MSSKNKKNVAKYFIGTIEKSYQVPADKDYPKNKGLLKDNAAKIDGANQLLELYFKTKKRKYLDNSKSCLNMFLHWTPALPERSSKESLSTFR